MPRRRTHRADDNQEEIVRALRAIGFSVLILSQQGDGCPDLLVGYRGRNYLVEIKRMTPKGHVAALRPEQVKFHSTWRGHRMVASTFTEIFEYVMADLERRAA